MHSAGTDHCSSIVFRGSQNKRPQLWLHGSCRGSLDPCSLVGREVRLSAQKEKGGRNATVGLRSEENL